MARSITLVEAGTGQSASLIEDNIILVENDTLGAQVTYIRELDGKRRGIITTATRPQIQSISSLIIPVASNGTTVGLNINRFMEVEETSTGCNILYYAEGAVARPIASTDSYQTILTRKFEKEGRTVYTFDAVNATNDTISLASSFGDLTSTFAATKVFNVFGTGDEDFDGLYTVSSSAYTGGKTVITVQQNIPSGVATSGSLVLGATS